MPLTIRGVFFLQAGLTEAVRIAYGRDDLEARRVPGLALLWLNSLLVLTVSLAGGARLPTLANGVMIFGLYGIGFVGGRVEQIGSFIHKQAAVDVGIAASLIFPGEALWKRAAFEMQSPLIRALGASPFAPLSAPNEVMIAYAILYIAAALVFAVRGFSRRDL